MAEKKRPPVRRLLHRYTVEIQDDDTFEKKLRLKLSRLHVFLILSAVVLMTAGFILLAAAYTPLLQYFPGITEVEFHRQVSRAHARIDSLRSEAAVRDRYIRNLLSLLRQEGREADTREPLIARLPIYAPVKGFVTDTFSLSGGHYGTDIAAARNSPVTAALDGKVFLAAHTKEDGYVLAIQHTHDLVSVYKHNARLLKKEGERVKAGEAVALAGATGEQATGPHLHFELWHNGEAVDPQKYIVFDVSKK